VTISPDELETPGVMGSVAASAAVAPGFVSVVIPAFNPGPYLAEAVASVVAQTETDWELVVVDDGSTAPFPALAADDRIRVVRKPNGGAASARNLGIDIATGAFLAFLDADDLWMPTKLRRQLDLMARHPALSLCATQFRHIDGRGVEGALGYGRPMSKADLLATGDGICTSSVMMRTSALAGRRFRPDVQPAEDFELWLRLSGEDPECFVPTVEVFYRHHASNLTLDYASTWRAVQKVYALHPDARGESGLAAYRTVFAHQAWDAARAGGVVRAARHIGFAARISPRTALSLALQTARSKLFRR
jgi:glycosyltransferase involved in cell wall biosynthesis